MLSSFSWQQYFAAIAIIGFAYYSYILLRYYQHEIAQALTSKKTTAPKLDINATQAFQVMGRAKQDPNVSIVDEQELLFTDEEQPEENEDNTASTAKTSDQIFNPQQQLIRETDQLLDAFATVDDKQEFIKLFKILVSTYDQYVAEIDHEQLSAYVIERSGTKLPFALTGVDLPN